MKRLVTTMGPRDLDPSDLSVPRRARLRRLPDAESDPAHAQADVAAVVGLMAPQLEAARGVGVTVLVDSTPLGVGRRTDVVKAVSDAAGLRFIVPTGVYREPLIPTWVREASEDEIADWMSRELTSEIGTTGVQAGWIKLSAGDEGLTPCETKVLRAAARAASATGSVIGSHTQRGRVLMDQIDVLEAAGHDPKRFIWVHAHLEPDFDLHLAAARRGVWVEYDGIGSVEDDYFVETIVRCADAGLLDRLLLSQDRGWFDPALPSGGTPQPFTYLVERFLPKLTEAGLDAAAIRQLTRDNPFAAYAR